MRIIGFLLALAVSASAQSREEVLAALRKASDFYRNKVSKEGGYHFSYAEDLSYGRSEHADGLNMIENQREGTPIAGMTFLEAWDMTRDRFYLDAARAAANALVKGQHCSGGWDYVTEFDPARRKRHPYRADDNCAAVNRPGGVDTWSQPYTNLDDNTTQGCLRLLMRVDRALDFKDAAIHEAALYALNKLIEVQYPNGAWPQRFYQPQDMSKFPVKKASYPDSWPRQWPGTNYQQHYTFNDNTISDMIDMFFEAARIYNEPRYRAAAQKGGDFILLAQMPGPQPAWAQQYDVDMHPVWARQFEPASVTGGESQGIMKTLMLVYQETGNRKYLEPVPRALEYLKRSVLPPVDRFVEARSRIPKGAPVLARFYELKTNRPLYIVKGTRVNVAGRPAINIDGYQAGYDDQSVITHYAVLTSGAELAPIEREYARLAAADPKTIARPDKLHGLSPWSDFGSGQPSGRGRRRAGDAKSVIASMDARGAWLEEGSIGKADRVVSMFAAKDMVVKIGGQVVPLKENQTLEVFQGTAPPRERIIRTGTFARNVEVLLEYLRQAPR